MRRIMRETEGGRLSRVFVGRHAEREEIKTRLADGERVLLLYGQPMVGKASLARQVAEELHAENEAQGKDPLVVFTVDCKKAVDWPGIMKAVCSTLSLDESSANENLLLGSVLQRVREARKGGTLLLLLKLHDLDPRGHHIERLTRFLSDLADSDVTSIMTSRRRLPLPSTFLVKPLTQNDALQLLGHHARDANPADFADILKQRCHGLPPLILQVAQHVGGDPMLAYTADELKQALEEDPGLLMRELGKEAERLFAGLSPEVQGHVNTLAQLLDGKFSVEALQAALGVEGARAKTVLRRLWDESPVVIDPSSQRMCIEPLVLHHVRQLGHMNADDQARLRVVTLIGRVLTHAEHELYVEGQNTMYGHLHGDWPQLQHILRQAIHCTDNTYQAYLKVAVESDKLLVKCFPEEALQFYRNMAAAAVTFGTPLDQAVLQGLIGMATTQGQGTGWQEALQYYHRALPVLRQDQRSINLPRLLCDMGFTYFRLNQLHEADRYLQEALRVSRVTEVEDERQIFLLIRVRSLLVLPAIFRGQLTASKNMLEETLELCSQLAPHHPDKSVLINSMGLVYERSGESQEMAMDYYLRSLAERRRYAAVAPGDMVPCLNNIGMQYGRREDYELAFKYLEEAADIRAKSGRWHYYTALTQQHLGQLCLQKGDYKRAEHHLLEAALVYSRCTPGHDVRGKVALCLAHVYITPPCHDVNSVKKYFTQVCELAEASGEDLSDSGLLVAMSAVQHRMQLDGWQPRRVRPLLGWIQQRLDQFTGDPSRQMSEHCSIMDAAAALCDSSTSEDQKEALTSRVLEHCQLCVALEASSDVREYWREAEKETESFRKGKSLLLESDSLKEILEMSENAQENQYSRLVAKVCPKLSIASGESRNQPRVPDRQMGSSASASQAEREIRQHGQSVVTVPGTGQGQEKKSSEQFGRYETGSRPECENLLACRAQDSAQETGLLQNVEDHFEFRGRESSTDQHADAGFQGRSAIDQYQQVLEWSLLGRNLPGTADQIEKLELFGVYSESRQQTGGHREAIPESRKSSGCSFTSSEPMSPLDITLPPTPNTIPREHLSDVTFQMGKFIFPLQETARDQQILQAMSRNSDYDADTSGVMLETQASSAELSMEGGLLDRWNIGADSGSRSQPSLQPPSPFRPSDRVDHEHTETDSMTTAAKSDTSVFDIQALRTIYATQRTTSTTSEVHAKHAGQDFAQMAGFSELPARDGDRQPVPHVATSASRSSGSRPEPTLDDVVICARRLLTAMPSDDRQPVGHVVTADQREALAKLASLHNDNTQWSRVSLEEQRAALVKIASQRTETSDSSSRASHSGTPSSSSSTGRSSNTFSTGISTTSTSSPKAPVSESSGYNLPPSSRIPCETDFQEPFKATTSFSSISLKTSVGDFVFTKQEEQSSAVSEREATENDERLENPDHICTSENCACSLQNPRY